MFKVFYLSTCSTCKRIIQELALPEQFELQDIKKNPIQKDQLSHMWSLAGTYEVLFSRRARKFKELGLGEIKLTEEDYRKLILQDYTFLKRPVIIIHNQIFIGNNSKVIQTVKDQLS